MAYNTRGLRRHYNAEPATGTALQHPDHVTQSGICTSCIKCGQCEIGAKAKTGHALFPQPFGTHQFGGEKITPSLNDLQIMPELEGACAVFSEIETETTLGGFKSKMPIAIAAMGSTRVANVHAQDLSEGAAKAGIPIVIGENVLMTYGEKEFKRRITSFLKRQEDHGAIIAQANVPEQKIGIARIAQKHGAHAIELKIGQGAKQGLGGEIKFEGAENAEKYIEAGYTVIPNTDGTYQRHALPGEITEKALRKNINSVSETGLPIWVKTGMGKGIIKLVQILERIKKEEKADIKCLTVDGYGGGTGMSPWTVMNEENIPSAALMSQLKTKPSFDILLAGGITDSADIAKSIMLGAKGTAMGRPFLIAAASAKSAGIANYSRALQEELQMICTTLKTKNVQELQKRKQNLVSITLEAEKWFGITSKPIL